MIHTVGAAAGQAEFGVLLSEATARFFRIAVEIQNPDLGVWRVGVLVVFSHIGRHAGSQDTIAFWVGRITAIHRERNG